MFFRFGVAVLLVVLISLAGTAIEKDALDLRRHLARQQYQRSVIEESIAKQRLEVEQLSAPGRWIESLEKGELPLERLERPTRHHPRTLFPLPVERTAQPAVSNPTPSGQPADLTAARSNQTVNRSVNQSVNPTARPRYRVVDLPATAPADTRPQ
jgi:hypothetical protein